MLLGVEFTCNEPETQEEPVTCCQLVDTLNGQALRCEFLTLVHCVGCSEAEPLFGGEPANSTEAESNRRVLDSIHFGRRKKIQVR